MCLSLPRPLLPLPTYIPYTTLFRSTTGAYAPPRALRGPPIRVGGAPSRATDASGAMQDRYDQGGCGRRCTMGADRKSTRLNSSHVASSYAVFCLKKKTELNIS